MFRRRHLVSCYLLHWIWFWLIVLIIYQFEFLIHKISFLILPFCIGLFNPLHENSGAILVIEIIFLESKHLRLVLFALIPSFQVLLLIANILNILVLNIPLSSFLLHNLVDLARVKVNLRGRVFRIQVLLDWGRRTDWVNIIYRCLPLVLCLFWHL